MACYRSSSENEEIIFNDVSLWVAEPTFQSIVVYSVAIPIVSLLGIVGNALILRVLCDGNFKASVFTYLTVLAAADLVTCFMLLFSGLARGVFWCKKGWLEFDVFVYIPVVSVSSNVTVWAAVCVTIDRLAIICRVYDLQNWLQFVMFGMVPAVLLLVANVIMCQSVKKTLKRRQLVLRHRNVREGNRLRDQARMTIMLVGVVLVFLVGEVPTHLASRRSALSLLYGGDPTKVSEQYMEGFRMYATLLSAIASSANFVLYCLLNRHFLSHLKRTLTSKPVRRKGVIGKGPYTVQQVDRSSDVASPSESNI
ncbi:uncharacterized protein LOC143186675 [Calliopsis andreniformis]|uniref:uncharacterized protein LOC143186675 n=1 Tax=Calliopsis andreniformis TaxID=337506 RepID=UPI003FCE08F2